VLLLPQLLTHIVSEKKFLQTTTITTLLASASTEILMLHTGGCV
jgi:pseudouridine-5'-phosphate glycosidase